MASRTYSVERHGVRNLLVLFLLVFLFLSGQTLGQRLGMLTEERTMVMSAEHAIERHGEDAVVAAKAIGEGGFNRYHCGDGRDRLIKSIPNGKGWKWAVVVLDADQFIGGLSWQAILDVCVTSFISTDRDYISRMIEPCKNDLNGGHP